MMLRQFNASKATKACVQGMVVCPIVLYTGLARVYEGMHTFDQIILGTTQGLLLTFLFTHSCYDYLIALYNQAPSMSYSALIFGNAYSLLVWASCFVFTGVLLQIRSTYQMPATWA